MKLHLSPSLHRALKTSFSLLAPIALTLSSSATTAPEKLDGNWTYVWGDEFDGDELNTDLWNYELGVIRNVGSQQSYTKDAVSVSDGNLVITSTYETTENCNYHPGETYWPYTMETMPYSSGSITTKGTYDFTYGRLEVSAKLPDATGAWPAIWLLGSEIKGWPRCGEIDILEHISQSEGTIFSTLHFTNEGLQYQSTGRSIHMDADSLYNEFHVYGMEWTETQIKVFVDDITVAIFDLDALNYAYGENPFNTDQYLIINTAIGGNGTWPESADSADYPVEYTVDYVRYYQYDAEAAAEGNGAMEWTATSDLTQTLSTTSSNLRAEAGFATGEADMIIHAASDSTGSILANQGSYTGDIRLDVQKAYISEQGLYAGHQDGTLSGDMIMRFSETARGGLSSSDGTGVSAFGAYAGDIDGNLYMEFSAQDLALGSTNASNSSVGSAYHGDISGDATLVFNKGDFQSRIIGGVVEGDESSIGGHVSLYLNGGTFHDDVIGGGLAGQVGGNTLVEIMGGDIQSNVYAGGSGSASVQGTTQLSIIGTAASFGADSILSASNESGTQTSDATLLLQSSESAPDRSHSLDGFSGTLTGGATSGTKTLIFDRVVADLSQANITDFDNISFKNSSEIILASSLGFDSFTMESSSSVTVQSQELNDSSFSSYGDANITFNQLHISGTSKLIGSGSSAAYTIEELTGTGNLRIENGTAASSERYEFNNINNFNGKIFSSWASGRSVQLSNITLDAGNSMILDGLFTADTGITQTGTGTLTLISYTSLNTSGTSSLEATVAGAGRLTKLGSGSLTFNGAVSHVGQLYVNAGSVTETQGAQFESVNISSDASYAINAAQSYTSESSFTGTGTLSLGSSNSAELTVMGAIDASVSIAVTGQVRLGSNITNNHLINLHSDDDGAESLSLLDGVQVTTGGGQASTAEQQDSYWRNSSVHLGKNALLDENIRLCVSGGSNTIDGSGSMQVKSLLLNGQSAGGATELNIGSGTTVNVLNDFHMTYSDSLAGTLNLDGKLIIQSNLGIQNKGEASSININDGACLQLNYGLTALGDQVAGGTSITVNKGATLALGNLASNAAVASTALLDVTIKDGATIAAYGNDATVTVAHQFDYELGAAITLQTQQNQTLEMTQALAKVDSVIVQGGGTVQLTGGATLSSSELQDTTLRISNTQASIDQITLHDNDLLINGTTLSSSELTTSEQSTITLQQGARIELVDADDKSTMSIATKDSSSDASITLNQEGASIESKQLSQAQVAHGLITIQSTSTPSPLLRAMAQSVYNSDASIYDTELVDTLIVLTSGASLRLDEVQLDSLSRISGDASSSIVANNLSIEATNAQNMSIEGVQYRISLLEADASTLITLEGMLNININMTADEYLAFTALLDTQVNPSIVLEGISSIEGLNAMGITISSTVDGVEQEMPDFAVVGLSEQGSLTLQAIPEPSSTSLSLLALAALLMRRKRRI